MLKMGSRVGAKARSVWSRVGFKSTAKIAAWFSRNKGWLSTVGLTAASAGVSALVSTAIQRYVQAKEEVATRWMESTQTLSPEAASSRKRVKAMSELRDCVNTIASYGDGERDDSYTNALIRSIELMCYITHNEQDDEVRRISSKAMTVISGCVEAGVVPEEGFTNPLLLRTLRNLSEDDTSATDIEGTIDCVLDIATTGAPLKTI